MWKRLPFVSIKTKMMFICLMVIIVPVFVMTINSHASSQRLLERKYTELLQDVVRQTNIRIDEFLNEVEKISLVASYGINSNISAYAEDNFPIQDYLKNPSSLNENAVYSMLMNYILLKDRVFSVYIYNLNGGRDMYVSSNQPFDYTYKAAEASWFKEFIQSDHKILTLKTGPDRQLRSKNLAILHARKVFDMASGKLLGVMVISIDLKVIDTVNSKLQEVLRPRLTIADDTGTILYSTDRERIGQRFEGSLRPDPSSNIVVSSPMDKMTWTTYLYTPLGELSAEGNLLKRSIYMLAGLTFFFALIVSIYSSNVITRPIKKLMKNITLVEKGQFELVEDIHSRDEIGHLSARFNKMSHELKRLVEQIQKDEVEKAAVEIRALQSQINPHFLYNTLGSVKWIASMQRVDKIVNMTEALISMLRYAARGEGEMVSVREELDNIANYLTIQNVRYYNKIQMIYDVDESLMDNRMPKLILQPLVENAVFHGLAEKEEDGVITVRVHRQGADISIEVQDNGVGMDEETIEALKKVRSRSTNLQKGIGLHNVERRIQLYFGHPYGVHFRSELGTGTTFRISLPHITDRQAEGYRREG